MDKDINKQQYNRTYMKGLWTKRRKEGLCFYCGKESVEGKSLCPKCFDVDQKRKKDRRLLYKKRAVEYLGGFCSGCGFKTSYVTVYDFHHENPGEKIGNLARMLSDNYGWKRIQKELDKCVLLCANCHRIMHEIEDMEVGKGGENG